MSVLFFVSLVTFLKEEKTFQGESKTAIVFLAYATGFLKLLKRSSLHLSVVVYLVYVN